MTKQELNRDVKRLFKNYYEASKVNPSNEYWEWIEKTVKPELKRLYYADTNFSALTLTSLKMMLRLNVSLRVIPFHHFGLSIDTDLTKW
jgi:hypothetical protein